MRACLAEGLGIRATARVFEVDPNTVLQWLLEAAEPLQAFTRYFLCDVHVEQLQHLGERHNAKITTQAGHAFGEQAEIDRLQHARERGVAKVLCSNSRSIFGKLSRTS